MTEADLKLFLRRRGSIKHKLTTFSKYVDSMKDSLKEDVILGDLTLRINRNESLLNDFEQVQSDIEAIVEDECMEDQLAQRDLFEQSYFSIMALAKQVIIDHKATLSEINQETSTSVIPNSLSNDTAHSLMGIKLPTIQLPKFTGAYEEWLEFKDTFESLIHTNKSINNIQKYHYLRASLEGTAATVIKALDFSAPNYEIAWGLICDRFDNRELLVHNHLKKLFHSTKMITDSSTSVRQLIDNISKHLRSLKILKQPVDTWDSIIIFIASEKFDKATSVEWEKQKPAGEFSTLEEMFRFLRDRANYLEKMELRQDNSGLVLPIAPKGLKHKGRTQVSLFSKDIKCNFCKGQHLIYNCAEFLKLPVQTRVIKSKELKLCLNCLKTGHYASKCQSGTCKACHAKHNSLLHEKEDRSCVHNHEAQVSLSSHCYDPYAQQVLLSTACVQVRDANGKYHTARAVLDSGSQSHFITHSLCDKLGLKTEPTQMTIIGCCQIASNIKSKCQINMHSSDNRFITNISCFVVPTISDNLPSSTIDTTSWYIPNRLNLADPNFQRSDKIDLLIGAGLFWKLLLNGTISLGKNKPTLRNTLLGWIVTGSILGEYSVTRCNFATNEDIQNQLIKFWETEEVTKSSACAIEQQMCDSHFKKHTIRQPSGRFTVKIPLKYSPERLGESKNTALKRLYAMERKFRTNSEFKEMYIAFMREYESLGHMTLVDNPDANNEVSYFLPHHGVFKMDSITTKLRVVFDGSAPTKSGWSLNDIQEVGPTIQEDLLSIIIRFRQHKFVLSGDIAKMYRQVDVAKDQRCLQRILWRYDPQDEIHTYELNTITYGTASGSYLAIRCLHQLAYDFQIDYPQASQVILRDFYVDDLLTGCDAIQDLLSIRNDVSNILKSGCFYLRKWISNNRDVIQGLHSDETAHDILNFGENEHTKTLGVRWSSRQDSLLYCISEPVSRASITKRSILSEIAQVFDPLGLLSPCTIIAKMILQSLWSLNIGWDDSIPSDLSNKWSMFRKRLIILNNLRIPRHVITENYVSVELHGFSDASQNAYGACLYARSIDPNGKIVVRLICAKSKVAPLKTITIPKLELNGALLLANLTQKVRKSFTIQTNCIYWSDSQVVLCWINTQPNLLLPFVSNRVSQIQDLTDSKSWRYVTSKDNPADLVSRGIFPEQLLTAESWWKGPSWLSLLEKEWPTENFSLKGDIPEFKRQSKVFTVIKIEETAFPFERFSTFRILKRVVGYCLRFVQNCRQPGSKLIDNPTMDELETAEKCIIKIAQKESFGEEIKSLNQSKALDGKNSLVALTPFIDSDGLLRVGGRLELSEFSPDKKHPFLLHNKHPLARIILSDEHKTLLHAGPQQLLSSTRDKFWIIGGRNLARKIVRSCIKCFRYNPKPSMSIMGNLPNHRVSAMYPFYATGIDYAGPFTVKERTGRCKKTFKCYICLFICLSTKAVHLELVTSLSTESFIATLKRFISRRGKPLHIYSDNGKNFVGAASELSELARFLKDNSNEICNSAASCDIRWHFIPPYSPNFGGLWEAGIKSTKSHLKKILGNAMLCFEELLTIITQIEGVLNSRPLSVLSSDPNDPQALTPAHFLIGRSFVSAAEPDVSGLNPGRLSRFQYIQQLTQHFWKRWSTEYVSELQKRTKWKKTSSSIKLDDIVLIKNDNLPPSCWQLGRVVQLHPGEDNITRVVSLKTSNGVVKRSLSKVCILPLEENEA